MPTAVAVLAHKWHHEVGPQLAGEYDAYFDKNVKVNLYGDEGDWERIKDVPNAYAFTDWPYK